MITRHGGDMQKFQLDCKFIISSQDDSFSPQKIQFISKKNMFIMIVDIFIA